MRTTKIVSIIDSMFLFAMHDLYLTLNIIIHLYSLLYFIFIFIYIKMRISRLSYNSPHVPRLDITQVKYTCIHQEYNLYKSKNRH